MDVKAVTPKLLTDEQKAMLLSRIKSEASDTKLAHEFGVSRKSVWRLRQAKPAPQVKKEAKPRAPHVKKDVKPRTERETTLPPPPSVEVTVVGIPVALPITEVIANDGSINRDFDEPSQERSLKDLVPELPEHPVKSITETKSLARPKAVPEITTMSYFAVQIKKSENFKNVVQVVLEAASKQGLLFRKLQVLDVTSVGANSFIRLRADIVDFVTLTKGLNDRAIIYPIGGSFCVYFADGRSGRIPASTMVAVPKIGFGQQYVGTRIKRWQKQFAA